MTIYTIFYTNIYHFDKRIDIIFGFCMSQWISHKKSGFYSEKLKYDIF